jgi:hypothetical protein
MPNWLKIWLGLHIAVIPPFVLLVYMAYSVVEWWPNSFWTQALVMYITLHVMLGWLFLAAKVMNRGK